MGGGCEEQAEEGEKEGQEGHLHVGHPDTVKSTTQDPRVRLQAETARDRENNEEGRRAVVLARKVVCSADHRGI